MGWQQQRVSVAFCRKKSIEKAIILYDEKRVELTNEDHVWNFAGQIPNIVSFKEIEANVWRSINISGRKLFKGM